MVARGFEVGQHGARSCVLHPCRVLPPFADAAMRAPSASQQPCCTFCPSHARPTTVWGMAPPRISTHQRHQEILAQTHFLHHQPDPPAALLSGVLSHPYEMVNFWRLRARPCLSLSAFTGPRTQGRYPLVPHSPFSILL